MYNEYLSANDEGSLKKPALPPHKEPLNHRQREES